MPSRQLSQNLLFVLPILFSVPLELAAELPSDRIDLSNWKLTLPVDTDRPGRPDEIRQPELKTFQDPRFFSLSPDGKSVEFRAPCDSGATTKGSEYPRSELREMQPGGTEHARWGIADGRRHRLTALLAVTQIPERKPHVICLQIHDEETKLIALRVEGRKLIAEGDSQKDVRILDDYQLGTPLHVTVDAADGIIRLAVDGREVLQWKSKGEGCYFKIGCYTQSNSKQGEPAGAGGEVAVYQLSVTHDD